MATQLPVGNTTTFLYTSPTRTDKFPSVYCIYSDAQHSIGFNLHYFLRAYRILGGMTNDQQRAKERRNKRQFVSLWEPRWKQIWENQIVNDPMVKPLIQIIEDTMANNPEPQEIRSEVRGMKDEGVTEWVLRTAYRKYSNRYISRIIETTRGLPSYPEFKVQ